MATLFRMMMGTHGTGSGMDELPNVAPYALAGIVLCTALWVVYQGCSHDKRAARAAASASVDAAAERDVRDAAARDGVPAPRLGGKYGKHGVYARNSTEAAILRELEEVESELSALEAEMAAAGHDVAGDDVVGDDSGDDGLDADAPPTDSAPAADAATAGNAAPSRIDAAISAMSASEVAAALAADKGRGGGAGGEGLRQRRR